LEVAVRHYPNARNPTIGRRVFLKRAMGQTRLETVRVHTLPELYDQEAAS
jgi:hypothetical protein